MVRVSSLGFSSSKGNSLNTNAMIYEPGLVITLHGTEHFIIITLIIDRHQSCVFGKHVGRFAHLTDQIPENVEELNKCIDGRYSQYNE